MEAMNQPIDLSAEDIRPYVPELEKRVQEINAQLAALNTDKALVERIIGELEEED